MTQITINDLEFNLELDRQALKGIKGGLQYSEYGQGRSSSTMWKHRYNRGNHYQQELAKKYDDFGCGNLGSGCHRK